MLERRGVWSVAVCVVIFIFLLGLEEVKASSEQTDMVILVDRSGSMKLEGGDPQGLSRAAVVYLLDQLELASDSNQAALILFKSTVTPIPKSGLTSNIQQIRDNLQTMANIGGNTDLEEALNVGLRFLAEGSSRKQMVLISDGKPEPDFRSNRAAERFPDLLQQWRKANTKQQKKAVKEKLSQISSERIQETLFGVLSEEQVELYPIALTGIQAHGEKLLKAMAHEVTKDKNAFQKLQAKDMISGLDTIVPKPVSLMNIQRAVLDEGGQSQWSADFALTSQLQKVRVLILYQESPGNLSWNLQGPSISISPQNPGPARWVRARTKNGEGRPIFERIFLDTPQQGKYTISFTSDAFLPKMQVIVEGRTNLRLAVKSEPNPGEVGFPVTFYCRLAGDNQGNLSSAKGSILDEKGEYVKSNVEFQPASSGTLSASWTPLTPGHYRFYVRGYLDQQKKSYLNTRHPFVVEPQQAIELKVKIPVRK